MLGTRLAESGLERLRGGLIADVPVGALREGVFFRRTSVDLSTGGSQGHVLM